MAHLHSPHIFQASAVNGTDEHPVKRARDVETNCSVFQDTKTVALCKLEHLLIFKMVKKVVNL